MNQISMEKLVQNMLEKQAIICRNDSVYKQDIEEMDGQLIVNWDFCGVQAYQIFKPTECVSELNRQLEKCDVTIVFTDEDKCRELLINEDVVQYTRMAITKDQHYEMGYDSGNPNADYQYYSGNVYDKVEDKVKIFEITAREGLTFKHFHLTRIPLFRPAFLEMFDMSLGDPKDLGYYIPINESLDGGAMARKIFHHFIDKTDHIYQLPVCPCRRFYGSKYRVDLGCFHMGDATLKIKNSEEKGKFISKEVAKKELDDAIEDGLIPLLGRSLGEAKGFGIADTHNGQFLSVCFCGEDACINGTTTTCGSSGGEYPFYRVPGLSLKVDRDKCISCGLCMDICVYRGMKWVDEKPEILDRCYGCGRCEKVCPTGAISFKLTEDLTTIADKAIEELNKVVDVTPQNK